MLSALFVAAPALADHSWGMYHWARTANPLTLNLGDNVSPTWDAHLAAASSDWSISEALDTAIVAGKTNATKGRNTPKNCLPTSGRVEVCSTRYGSNGWLGIASIWVSGSHITQGTVKLNDTYFNIAKYNTSAWRQLVVCQEIGHTFGLDHQDEDFNNQNLGTCMDYTNAPAGGVVGGFEYGISNEHPNTHDWDQLALIYSHADSFVSSLSKTSGSGAASVADVDTSNPREWGRAIRASRDGHSSLYERNLGNGQTLFTFVVWTQ